MTEAAEEDGLNPRPPHSGVGGTARVFPKSPVKGYFSRDKVRPEFEWPEIGGVLSNGGNKHTRTLNNTEWGAGVEPWWEMKKLSLLGINF